MQFEIEKIQEASEHLAIGSRQLATAESAHRETADHVSAALPLLEEITGLVRTVEQLLIANRNAALSIREHLNNAIQHSKQANLPHESVSAKDLRTLLAGIDFTTKQIRDNTYRAENTGIPMGFAPEYYAARLEDYQSCQETLDNIAGNYNEAQQYNTAAIEAGEAFIART